MSALTREQLIEACADLYATAHESLALPPLIHGVGDVDPSSSYAFQCVASDAQLEFKVEFDADYVRRHGFPLEKLPIRFYAKLCDRRGRDLDAQLSEKEMVALTYAFLLGVRAPIALDLDEEAREWKCSIQLAPAFFVEWRQPLVGRHQATPEGICRALGMSLYERSRDFFVSEADGVAIWTLRASQELLGETKPSATDLWPRFLEDVLQPGGGEAAPSKPAITLAAPSPAPRPALASGGEQRFSLTAPAAAARSSLAVAPAARSSLAAPLMATPRPNLMPPFVASKPMALPLAELYPALTPPLVATRVSVAPAAARGWPLYAAGVAAVALAAFGVVQMEGASLARLKTPVATVEPIAVVAVAPPAATMALEKPTPPPLSEAAIDQSTAWPVTPDQQQATSNIETASLEPNDIAGASLTSGGASPKIGANLHRPHSAKAAPSPRAGGKTAGHGAPNSQKASQGGSDDPFSEMGRALNHFTSGVARSLRRLTTL